MGSHTHKNGDIRRYPIPVHETQLPATEFYETSPDHEEAPGLGDLLELLLRRKWVILTFVMIIFIAALISTLLTKPVFKAQGRLEATPSRPRITKFENIVDDRYREEDFITTQVELLQSSTLARRVIEKLGLEENPSFNPALEEHYEKGFLKNIKESLEGIRRLKHIAVEWIRPGESSQGSGDSPDLYKSYETYMNYKFISDLDVSYSRGTTLIHVAFNSTDPNLAYQVANTTIQEFINWQMDMRMDSVRRAKDQLEKQLDVARSQLVKSEEELNRFAEESGIISLDPNSRLTLVYRQLEAINEALATTEAERIKKDELYRQAKDADAASLPLVLQNSLIQNLKEQHISVMSEYEKLRITFKDDYPALKTLKGKIRDIGRKIETEQKHILKSLENDYHAARNTEKALRTTANEKRALALHYNDLISNYRTREREVEVNNQIFQSLLERSKEIDANLGTDPGNIKVVDFASFPLRPYKPNVSFNLITALFLGLMGGSGLAFLLEHLDNTVKRVDEISSRHLIPILGVIPFVKKRKSKNLNSWVWSNPSSPFSEAVRITKTTIQLLSFNDEPAKSLFITSTSPNEGKSTIACNLAYAFASSDEKVLLIDADLQRSCLHDHLGNGPASKGLMHYLKGLSKLKDVVQKTEIPNLYFIASGLILDSSNECLYSDRMRNLMKILSNHFDRIIIDGPPFGSDSLILGNHADGVILIAALGQTHHERIRLFRRNMMYTRTRLLGSVINKLDINRYLGNHAGKHYYYSYG